MKIQGLLLATFSLIGMSGVFAQEVEFDDMYFNAKDRAVLNSQRGTAQLAYNTPKKAKQLDIAKEESENPTDSYSARNVNPEYIARENSESAQTDEENYFVDNYQYNRTELNNWNNNFNSWYNNSWYRSNYYGPGINTWNSPYYGYNSWNSPWNDPYWSYNGWSSSFSYHYGSRWNYGWGGSYNYWNRPYYGWNSYAWDPMMSGMGYYGGSYWNNYRYPYTVVVVGDGGRDMVYGKRPTRGTSIVSDRNNVRSRTSTTNAVRNDDPNSSGRVSTQGRKQDEYYNRYNRQRTTTYPSDSRTNTQNNRSRSWDNSSWDSNNNNSRSTSSPSYSPSYSPSNSSGGTRTNNSGSSTGGRRGRD
ncbi:MAG TPA: hypothetical protein VFO54_03210 [Chryseosolibacter sp.]|nr:hypothetical protein [Chryseosolibacter sp.]